MKYLAITAALMLSSTAFAQSTPPAEPSTPSMPAPEAPPTGDMPTSPPEGTTMPAPPAAPAAPAMPDATTAPATPDPAASGQAMMQSPAPPAPAAQAEYPRCSRTVVDQCIQGASRERNTKRRPRRS